MIDANDNGARTAGALAASPPFFETCFELARLALRGARWWLWIRWEDRKLARDGWKVCPACGAGDGRDACKVCEGYGCVALEERAT